MDFRSAARPGVAPAKRAHRMVLYAMHPAEMLNLRASVYAARMQVFKTTIMTHLLMKGAVDVGIIQAPTRQRGKRPEPLRQY